MKNCYSQLAVLFMFCIIINACKHEPPPLPDPPKEKTDYMCATLNGVQWESCTNDFWLSDTDSEIYNSEWFCYGLFYCVDFTSFDLGFESTLPLEIGIYSMNGGATYGTVTLNYTTGFIDTFTTDSNHTGVLEITKIDTIAEEIHGN
jgi:hypothetical protein